ncbi:hypothetical protein EZV62_012166 [Acer yangbiense]|uniref:Protein ENHANCED DISEASE RESISTANCE 2 C-terminal domain-containing protein n=1 Tax=Acer yangbiense TaxID=1000413 RepID=A0A5C7HUN2_9ROSI|nr:hypothetical protein EZV62_012166 [Acer yangbiense]
MIIGGDPLLKLIAVDWLKADKAADRISLHPKCLVQSDAGKKLPFILVFNLQVPAKPNYNLVLYYASSRPVNKDSLLGKFVDGTDAYRDSRFKLIPSIVEGYWMVKRAVGTKACLLGKAVTCRYLRQDNFLEIDVDIGSSSVARSVIGLVLGYVTSLVVDLGILIEAKEEGELPEYVLGTVQLNCIRLDSAVALECKEARGEKPTSEETFNVECLLQHRRRTAPPPVKPTPDPTSPEKEQSTPPPALEEALSSSMDVNRGLASSFGH